MSGKTGQGRTGIGGPSGRKTGSDLRQRRLRLGPQQHPVTGALRIGALSGTAHVRKAGQGRGLAARVVRTRRNIECGIEEPHS